MFIDILKHFFFIQDLKKEKQDCFNILDSGRYINGSIQTLKTANALFEFTFNKPFSKKTAPYKKSFGFEQLGMFNTLIWVYGIVGLLPFILSTVGIVDNFGSSLFIFFIMPLVIQNVRRFKLSVIKGQVEEHYNQMNLSPQEKEAMYKKFFLNYYLNFPRSMPKELLCKEPTLVKRKRL